MSIELKKTASKELSKLDSLARKQIIEGLSAFENHPESGDVKKLKGMDQTWRLRIGDYRIFFEYVEQTIVVLSIRHRKDAYR